MADNLEYDTVTTPRICEAAHQADAAPHFFECSFFICSVFTELKGYALLLFRKRIYTKYALKGHAYSSYSPSVLGLGTRTVPDLSLLFP
jgi:hypothetical protein